MADIRAAGRRAEFLRILDLVSYVRSLCFAGFSLPLPEPASPMFHGNERVGNIFLTGGEDRREFSAVLNALVLATTGWRLCAGCTDQLPSKGPVCI